ncbi:MAG TPA: GDSL lipase [Mycobacterium sp.]|nr:GDSL lipase [Mycobacterium sp.]
MGRPATLVVSLVLLGGVLGSHSSAPSAMRPVAILSLGSPVAHVAVVGDSYTTGTDEGGLGPRSWPAQAWQTLARQGVQVAPDVASEGRAGYAVLGDHGSDFEDLTARAVHPNDGLVVFFGSRNDQGVDAGLLAEKARSSFDLARRIAPSARLLVIGPPWPTADPPAEVLQVDDIISGQAAAVDAAYVDAIAEHWFVDRPDLIGPDGVHPTDAGHEYMAEMIAPLIRAQLPRRP